MQVLAQKLKLAQRLFAVDLSTITSVNTDKCNKIISICFCLFAEGFHPTMLLYNRIVAMMSLVYLKEDGKCLINKDHPVGPIFVFHIEEHLIQHIKLIPIPLELIDTDDHAFYPASPLSYPSREEIKVDLLQLVVSMSWCLYPWNTSDACTSYIAICIFARRIFV